MNKIKENIGLDIYKLGAFYHLMRLVYIARDHYSHKSPIEDIKHVIMIQKGSFSYFDIFVVADETIWLPSYYDIYYGKIIQIFIRLDPSPELHQLTFHLSDPIEKCGIYDLQTNSRYNPLELRYWGL
jgi:hypothetical protein